MFILPLEFGYKTTQRAWLTFFLVGLMLFIHWRVEINAEKVGEAVARYCASDDGEAFSKLLRRQSQLPDDEDAEYWRCDSVVGLIAGVGDKPGAYDYVLDDDSFAHLDERGQDRLRADLEQQVGKAELYVPRLLQEKLAQPAQSLNPVRMLTATLAHGDWWHVIFNMVFLIAFGCILEVVIGPIAYLGFMFASVLTVGLSYAIATQLNGDTLGLSLGFSGVDFTLLGALLFLMPLAPIKSIVFIGIIPIPMRLGVWVFGLVFLGGQLWFLFEQGPFDESTGVNTLAHAVGGVTGFVLAAWLLRPLKKQLSDLLDRAAVQEWSQR
ncbi:rhomboid family intramembrane serine protease [Permianibacter sp. IMCC34836]|uniref:rhomboid family intramembrane serine protease n=1 Tax=Permianibacter fluminis TaxID=2738515 RepID=UPI001557A910|nr:rhomboid family intramembrane serine protease [Permianibacter fluminis]NQD35963.1 rhomboid family intramembrane serine protease [Permianibacter fluminis]